MQTKRPFASLFMLGSIMKRLPNMLGSLGWLVSFRYWGGDARKFRRARDEWRAVSALFRHLLADIDDAFERIDGDARNLKEEIEDIRSSSNEASVLGKRVNRIAAVLRSLR